MNTGIDAMGCYVPQCVLDLRLLAEARGISYAKLRRGLGQEEMAVAPPGEDIVTMGAHAAREALTHVDRASLDAVIVATESGIDQSKSAAIYLHRLLGLPKHCKAFEIKQACCGSTVALQLAQSMVHMQPDRRVLVVATDIARYEHGSAAEPTQGAGSMAFVVSRNPRILRIDPMVGTYTNDVMDFWRPNYRETACVDGHYSIRVYLRALAEAWQGYREAGGPGFEAHERFCYHLPFTRMATKAHERLRHTAGCPVRSAIDLHDPIHDGMMYNRRVGNTYTASLYLALLSLLERSETALTHMRIGMFSYGSGCMGAFFSGVVQPGYLAHLHARRHRQMLDGRRALTLDEYEAIQAYRLPEDGRTVCLPTADTAGFRFIGLQGHRRLYTHDTPEQQEAA